MGQRVMAGVHRGMNQTRNTAHRTRQTREHIAIGQPVLRKPIPPCLGPRLARLVRRFSMLSRSTNKSFPTLDELLRLPANMHLATTPKTLCKTLHGKEPSHGIPVSASARKLKVVSKHIVSCSYKAVGNLTEPLRQTFPQVQPVSMVHPQSTSPKITECHSHSAQRNHAAPAPPRKRHAYTSIAEEGVISPVSASLDFVVETPWSLENLSLLHHRRILSGSSRR